MRRSSCLAALLAWFGAAAALELAPTPAFETFDTEDGLPSSLVQTIAEDRNGFLWVGTLDGLARYDGTGFEVFRRDPAVADSLPSNLVQAVLVDSADRVWVGTTDGGLAMLDQTRSGFRQWREGLRDEAFSGTDVWAIAEAPDGAIWAGTFDGGANRLDPASGAVRVFRHAPDDADRIAADAVLDLVVDSKGRVWLATTAGLTRLDPAPGANGELAYRARHWLAGSVVVSLHADADDTVWIGTQTGMLRFAPNADAPEPFPLPLSAGVQDVVIDAGGRRWFATRSGPLLERSAGDFVEFRGGDPRRYAFPAGQVLDALSDREGGLWFAVFESGLVHVKPQWSNFSLFRAPARERAPTLDTRTRAVGRCADGTLVSDADPGEVLRIDPLVGTSVRIPILTQAIRGAVPGVRAVLCAKGPHFWVGHRFGVARYQPGTRRVDAFGPEQGFGAGPVDQLLEDGDGAVWVSVLGDAMYRFTADASRHVRYAADDTSLSREVEQLGLDAEGELLAVGTAGVARFDRAADRFVRLDGAPQGRVHAFAPTPSGSLWLQTVDALTEVRRVGDRLATQRRFAAGAELPAAEAGSLFITRDGVLWLAGPRGLFRIDPGTGVARQFGRADGLFVSELSNRPGAQAPDGTIAVASTLGVIAFDPTRLRDNTVAPRVVLAELSVLRGARRIALDPAAPIELGHDDRDLRIVLRALSLADPMANRYRFRLDGFDPDWVPGARGERVFAVLPEGEFVLRGEAANPSGVWAEAPVAIRLKVAPPPWRSAPALALYAALLLGLGFGVAQALRTRMKRRHLLELAEARQLAAERQSQAKSEFLADVGHEIRTPMSGLLGMTELLLRSALEPKQRGYALTVQRSGQHLLKLINDLLDLSRIEAGRFALDPQPCDLWALIDEVIELQQPLAHERGLALEGHVAADAPRQVLIDAVRLKQVLLNLVNNALKFTERGRVDLSLARAASGLRIEVADTGPGMSADTVAKLFGRYEQGAVRRRGGSGLGLAISRALIELMGGRIAVESAPGKGSRFALLLEPQSAPESATASEATPGAAQGSAGRTLELLVVEDDATIRTVLVDLLSELGHRVEAGANGLDALRLLSEHHFDAALIDLDLPGVDGLKLIRLVRKREAGAPARLPAIAITANSSPGIESEARTAGFNGFLRKPVSGAELAHALGALLLSGDTVR
jgi:signal transduction histidine kinase/ActR/RegA family two-component response regulator